MKDRADRLSGGAKDVRESYLSKQMLIMSDVLQANQQDELPSPSEIDGIQRVPSNQSPFVRRIS